MLLDKLSICKSTREFASRAFLNSLKKLLIKKTSISEKDLAEEWLFQLRANFKIFPEGWFTPPPHGITVLKNCLKINKEIFNQIKKRKKLSEVSNSANKILDNYGFENGDISLSDPAKTNIGHTVPFSYENMTSEEKKVLDNGDKDWETTKNMIAKKRKFVSTIETFNIRKGMGFTLEPRPYVPNDNKTPSVWYHTIVLIKENGDKELLTDFEEIFKFTRMDYMLDNL